MEGLRGDRISMIFQEPNAALNPTMSIGDQVSESFLFHQKKEMCAKILEDPSGLVDPLEIWALDGHTCFSNICSQNRRINFRGINAKGFDMKLNCRFYIS